MINSDLMKEHLISQSNDYSVNPCLNCVDTQIKAADGKSIYLYFKGKLFTFRELSEVRARPDNISPWNIK